MGFFIASIGLMFIIAGVMGFLILVILKRPKKLAAIVAVVGVLLYIIGAIITPSDELGNSEILEIMINTYESY